MIKIGVIGAGHLGKIHLKCIMQIPEFQLVGFFDIDDVNAAKVEAELKVKRFYSIEDLIHDCDAVDIVTPTISHHHYASLALKNFKHVFIEKPIVTTVEEAKSLLAISREANVKIQVGHVERFNPAFIAAQPYFGKPLFIESHRLAMFNPRGCDVPVVLDLMIHDIDIILSVVKANVRKVSASGVAIVSSTPDIANARIEFDNGCVANLTASRISMKNMRKSRFFQQDAYISVDFFEKKTEVIRMNEISDREALSPLAMIIEPGNNMPAKEISIALPEIQPINAIQRELEKFHEAIVKNEPTPVGILDGYAALDVAYQIMKKIEESISNFS